MMAIIIADLYRKGMITTAQRVHRCTTVRVVRSQFISGKGMFPHFGLFCMVSAGKDTGSYSCEQELLIRQLEYYKTLFHEKYGANLSIVLRKRSGYTDNQGFFDKMTELIRKELPEVPITFDLDHEDNNYYKGINFKIYFEKDNEKLEIGDGGFVDWIAKMMDNNKMRCLISGLGTDRMLLY